MLFPAQHAAVKMDFVPVYKVFKMKKTNRNQPSLSVLLDGEKAAVFLTVF